MLNAGLPDRVPAGVARFHRPDPALKALRPYDPWDAPVLL
jgi:hypothetical protein